MTIFLAMRKYLPGPWRPAPTIGAEGTASGALPLADDRMLQRQVWLLLAVIILLPIMFSIALFPTPNDDTREHINWGLAFPLYTWKHPPLQSWIGGVLALAGIGDNWIYVLGSELLKLVGLFYFVRIVVAFIDARLALFAAVAFYANVFAIVGPLFHTFNADQIQVPLWLGLLYHALCAMRDDCWRDWIAAGVFAGLCMLAKYTAGAFILCLTAALLASADFRPLLRRAGPYLAMAVGGAIVLPHFVAMLKHPDLLQYDEDTFKPWPLLWPRIVGISGFIAGLACGAQFLLAWLYATAQGESDRAPLRTPAARVIVATSLLLCGFFLVLVLTVGLQYAYRYSAPLLPILALMVFVMVRPSGEQVRRFVRAMPLMVALSWVGGLGFAILFYAPRMQEPVDRAAEVMRSQWDARFSCGPAYIVGAQRNAHGLGVYYGRPTLGISDLDYLRAPWIDRKRAHEHGVVIIAGFENETPNPVADLVSNEAPQTLKLPYRRFFRRGEETYVYWFVPPKGC